MRDGLSAREQAMLNEHTGLGVSERERAGIHANFVEAFLELLPNDGPATTDSKLAALVFLGPPYLNYPENSFSLQLRLYSAETVAHVRAVLEDLQLLWRRWPNGCYNALPLADMLSEMNEEAEAEEV